MNYWRISAEVTDAEDAAEILGAIEKPFPGPAHAHVENVCGEIYTLLVQYFRKHPEVLEFVDSERVLVKVEINCISKPPRPMRPGSTYGGA
jgi:hypothetical protein